MMILEITDKMMLRMSLNSLNSVAFFVSLIHYCTLISGISTSGTIISHFRRNQEVC
jgi:hypothetical protein